jgi:hypothetical protein
MTLYQRVTYLPEGAKRARSVILADPTTDGWSIRGTEVDREGVNVGDATVSRRIHIIDLGVVKRRRAMVMDTHYGVLVETAVTNEETT